MPIARLGAGGTNSKRSNLHAPNTGASFAGLRPGLGRAGVTKMFSLVGKGGGLHKPIVVFQNQVGGIGRRRLRNWGGVHRPAPVAPPVQDDGLKHVHEHENGVIHEHDYADDGPDHDHAHDIIDLNSDGVIDVEDQNILDDFKGIAEKIYIALNYTSTVNDILHNLIDAYKKHKGQPCYHADLAGTAVMGTHSLEDCACNECNISYRVHKDMNGNDIYFPGKKPRCTEVAYGLQKAYLHIYKPDDGPDHDHAHDIIDLNSDGVIDVEDQNILDDFKGIAEKIYIALNYTSTVNDILHNLIDAYKKHKGQPCYHADLAGTAVMGTHSLEDCACNECNISYRVHKDMNGNDIYFPGKKPRCTEVAYGLQKAYLHIYKPDDDHHHHADHHQDHHHHDDDHHHDDHHHADHHQDHHHHDDDHHHHDGHHDLHKAISAVQDWAQTQFATYPLISSYTYDTLWKEVIDYMKTLPKTGIYHMTYIKSAENQILTHVDGADNVLCDETFACVSSSRVYQKFGTLDYVYYDTESLDVTKCAKTAINYGDIILYLHFIPMMFDLPFDAMDSNNDETVTTQDAIDYMATYTDFSAKEAHTIATTLDTNRDGKIDQVEQDKWDMNHDGIVEKIEFNLEANKTLLIESLRQKIQYHLKSKTKCVFQFLLDILTTRIINNIESIIDQTGVYKMLVDLTNINTIKVNDSCTDMCMKGDAVHTNSNTGELYTPIYMLQQETVRDLHGCLSESHEGLSVDLDVMHNIHTQKSFNEAWVHYSNRHHLLDVPLLVKQAMARSNHDLNATYILAVISPTLTTACPGTETTYMKSKLFKPDCAGTACHSMSACIEDEGFNSHLGTSTPVELTCFNSWIENKELVYFSKVLNMIVVVFE